MIQGKYVSKILKSYNVMKIYIKFLLLLLFVSFVITTSIFWTFEHKSNFELRTFGDVVWWWIITSSTVGYGDITPTTWQGRIAAVITIIIGMYLYTNFVTIIADLIRQSIEKENKGLAQVQSKNHIVICEYTAFADELIQEVNNGKYPFLQKKDIAIVTNLVDKNPYPKHKFVFGVPINPDSLAQTNTKYADYIFVFANARFGNPDLKTLHIVSRIQKINKNATIFVELINIDSEALKYIESHSNKIIPMDTNELLEFVLMRNTIDLDYFIKSHGKYLF
jgi:voltage-gated potassium channel